jgi:YesN/AraC family two-component response regulator
MSGSLRAANGILIVEKTTQGGTSTTNQIQIEANRMRAESTGPGGVKQVVIFDGARQVLTMIDNQNKSYTEMTKEDAEKLGAQTSDAMAQMKKQLAGMPPDQRAKIEAMMKGRMDGAGGAAARPQFRKAGTETVGKWTCTKYESYEGEVKTSEVCTVEPKTLGLTEADFAFTKQFIEFFKSVVPQMASQAFAIGTVEQQGFSGVPIKRKVSILGGEVMTEIIDVTRQAFPDSNYVVPAGYQKKPFGTNR